MMFDKILPYQSVEGVETGLSQQHVTTPDPEEDGSQDSHSEDSSRSLTPSSPVDSLLPFLKSLEGRDSLALKEPLVANAEKTRNDNRSNLTSEQSRGRDEMALGRGAGGTAAVVLHDLDVDELVKTIRALEANGEDLLSAVHETALERDLLRALLEEMRDAWAEERASVAEKTAAVRNIHRRMMEDLETSSQFSAIREDNRLTLQRVEKIEERLRSSEVYGQNVASELNRTRSERDSVTTELAATARSLEKAEARIDELVSAGMASEERAKCAELERAASLRRVADLETQLRKIMDSWTEEKESMAEQTSTTQQRIAEVSSELATSRDDNRRALQRVEELETRLKKSEIDGQTIANKLKLAHDERDVALAELAASSKSLKKADARAKELSSCSKELKERSKSTQTERNAAWSLPTYLQKQRTSKIQDGKLALKLNQDCAKRDAGFFQWPATAGPLQLAEAHFDMQYFV